MRRKLCHFAAAYGNLNTISFYADEKVVVEPVFYRPETLTELEKNMIMFYTKLKRDASEVVKEQQKEAVNKKALLRKMKELVPELRETLSSGVDLNRVGEILHKGWILKRSLTKNISNGVIDSYYEKARSAGALGGKLLGAGGGGFLLLYIEKQNRDRVIKSLKELYSMPVGIHAGGSRITYYDQTMVK